MGRYLRKLDSSMPTTQPSHSWVGTQQMRTCLHKRHACGVACNSPKLETTQVTTDRRMEEHGEVGSYNGIFYSSKNEQCTQQSNAPLDEFITVTRTAGNLHKEYALSDSI